MGMLAGLMGGAGGGGGGPGVITGSGQSLGPKMRGIFQTQAISRSRQFVQAGKQVRVGRFRGLTRQSAARVNEQIALRNALNPFDRNVSRSQLGAEFQTKDLQRAVKNKDLFSQLFGGGKRGGGSGGSFMGRPQGASSFTSLLRSF